LRKERTKRKAEVKIKVEKSARLRIEELKKVEAKAEVTVNNARLKHNI
jgi:hypothetical protein